MNPLRVFIVDDDRDFAESLGLLIEGQGYNVELAFSGEEAIDKFREQDFDITFMDVRLPGKSGTESFIDIRKFKPTARVVMMTGYSVEQLLEQAVEHGAWGVLKKPIAVDQIMEKIEQIKPDGILIVDDNADFVESIKNLLVDNGYEVFISTNGKEAVDRIRSNGIDILILDLHLPILSGLETYLELKRTGHTVPTIIVTAYLEEYTDDLDKLKSLSISGVLRKPFNPQDLLNAVEHLVHSRKKKHNVDRET